MNTTKGGKTGREAPILDPQLIRSCMTALQQEGTEFPIKVEGTSTLPYASVALSLEWEKRQFILKLVRPLPHELALGAVFRMIFSVSDQRYEGLTTFKGREAYLQYRFDLPSELFHSDRRRNPRLPFRPRESAYVIAQSGALVGVGVAGPLANIGMGGLALRVDRLVRLEDKMRLPVHAGSLDIGLVFDRLRLQDLPRLPLLELRGKVAHLTSKGSEIILGLEFGGLGEEEAQVLSDCLSFREKLSRGSSSAPRVSPGSDAPSRPRESSGTSDEPTQDEGEGAPELEEADSPLRTLQRRTTRLGLIMAASETRDAVQELLGRHGYLRVQLARDLGQAKALWGGEGPRPKLVLAELSTAPQTFEQLLKHLGDIPGVLLSDTTDPSLMMGLDSHTRALPNRPPSEEEEEHWIRTVDGLAGIES
ncbi:MAG: hypothetical protein H6Q00_355 [Holophagaceae bacterium]|nr:hypothetical protein [Holophagaceae bacterium]